MDSTKNKFQGIDDAFGEPVERAKRFNTGKPKWHLVHMKSLTPLVRVMEFGATKYDERNWMKPMNTTELLNSLQRHLNELMDDNEIDEESKQHHIGHIMANAMMYSYHKGLYKE